jgi:hypothetical protein
MRCEDIEDLLDEHAEAALTFAQKQDVDAHLATCEKCSTAWLAARALHRYGELLTPAPRPSPGSIERFLAVQQPRAARRAPRWVAAIGGALAAGLALVAFDYYFERTDDRIRTAPSLTMSLHETRDVSVAIDSPEAFMDVEVRILLAGGIELEGLGSRRELKWTTDLEPGINRLTLPIIASDSTGGRVLVAVGYGDKQRAFVVQIDVDDDAANTDI